MLAVGKQRSESLPAGQQAALTFLEANAEDLTQTKRLVMADHLTAPPAAAPQPSSDPSSSSSSSSSFPPSSPDTTGIPSNSVDLYTVAFGIRNFSNIPAALREAHRVLKPGGVFACLEFGKVTSSWFDAVYRRWSFGAIPLIGQLVAADRDSYQYLVESIDRFPRQDRFRDMIVDAGFLVAGRGWEDLTGGVAAIHKGMKPRE
ncbi:hypothetical protein VTK73DRAFT_3150 [Phialemonium thermophilum]|uniref:2-methoxy-6-polyprenyl-1,4-benzoquinol methylase, mitochondrial n=1 Tax=Phialemonium thermophilum TaxID=223376 RepID=A0ABR3VLQ8_9PEZI